MNLILEFDLTRKDKFVGGILKSFFILMFTFYSLLFSLSLSASSYIDGRGHFFAKNDDSLKFVKDQLLSNAFKDVITKELKNMGLDGESFWQKHNHKFEERFLPIAENLRLKYKMDEDLANLKEQEKYKTELRMRKLRLKAKFGKLSKVIQSYSIKNMSRSTKSSSSRYLSLSAKVNRKLLRDLFFKFTREGETRHFKTLYVNAKFSLDAMTWKETGVEVEVDFTNVIKEHWRKWFYQNLNSFVDNIVITDIQTEEKINDYLKALKGQKEADLRPSILSFVNDEFKDSLYLKVSSKIKKINDDLILNNREFEITGDFILVDLKTNKLIKHYDYAQEKKKIDTVNLHDLSSSLASTVYQIPIAAFGELPKILSSLPSNFSRVKVDILNVKNILDLIKIKKLLASKGLAYRFESEINSYNGDKGSLLLIYQGDKKNILQTVGRLNEVEIGLGRVMTIDFPENPLKIIIKENLKAEKDERSS